MENVTRMMDGIFRTRSLGVSAEGIPDQYADGAAARIWHLYVGASAERTKAYADWLCDRLRKSGHKRILDVACGTGIDSVMLVERGFKVVSVDASDKMLKYALKTRWDRRKEEAFNNWVIEEANWLSLPDDLEYMKDSQAHPDGGFDAIICLGNSFAHLLDFAGEQKLHRQAIANFHKVLKPGGTLIIDHRNYDYMLKTGQAPPGKNIYYKGDYLVDIKCSNLYVGGTATMNTLDYTVDATSLLSEADRAQLNKLPTEQRSALTQSKFRLSYFPHRVAEFTGMLRGVFGQEAPYTLLGDYLDVKKQAPDFTPCYYIHVIDKV